MIQKPIIQDLSQKAGSLFKHYHCFDCIDSTNTWLLDHHVPGSICLANQQTAGKGTKGRDWSSEVPENLYFSFSLTHQYEQGSGLTPPLSLLAGLACCEALESLSMRGQGIKWPNDIYCNNKKLAGILVESAHHTDYWVIGVGMNLHSAPANLADQQATYVNAYLDVHVNPQQMAVAILNSFASLYFDSENWLDKWNRWDILNGQEVTIVRGKQKSLAKIHGLNPQGELIAEIDGELKAIASGEVSIRQFIQPHV